MSNTNNIPSILETIILQPLFPNKSGIPFTASTGIYTTFVHALSGNSQISFNTNSIDISGGSLNVPTVSGDTISGNIFLSGGTNLFDIINAAAGGLTGGTFNNQILTLTSANNTQVQVSGFTDFYTTGTTFNTINSVATFTRNDGGVYNLNLSGLVPTTTVSITGATYSNGTITFKNSTGGTFQVSGFIASAITSTTLTNNILNVTAAGGSLTAITINAVTGGTYSAGTITFQGSGVLGSITGLTTGTTQGIDTVLAVGQKFTTNRTMDLSGFTLNFNNPHFTYTGLNTSAPIQYYPSFPFGTKERLLMNGGLGNRAWDIAYSTDSAGDVISAQGWNVDSTFDPTQPSFTTRMEYQYLGHLYEYHLQWSSADAQRIYRLMSFTLRDQGGVGPTGDSVVLFFKGGDAEFRPLSVDNSYFDVTSSYDSGLDQSIMAIRTIGTGLGVYHKLEASNGYHITAAAGAMQEWHDAFTSYKWQISPNTGTQTFTFSDFYNAGYAITQLSTTRADAAPGHQLVADTGEFLQVGIWNSGVPTTGVVTAKRANIYTSSPSGMTFISSDTAGKFLWSIGAGFPQVAQLKTSGQWQWNNYGLGSFTGTTAKILGVTSSGDVIEINASSISGVTPGIDSVLAVGQSLSANRTINLSSFTLSFSSITASNNLNLSGGNVGIGVVTSGITNRLHVSAATNPVRVQGLTANTGDTNVVSIDATGVIHTYPVSSLSGFIPSNNVVVLFGSHSNDVVLPHGTVAVNNKFYVGGSLVVAGFGSVVCYNDQNNLTNRTTIIPFSANMTSFFAMCYSSVNDRIYTIGTVQTGSTHYALITINPNTNAYTAQTLTGVTVSNNDISQYGMDTDDTNLYIGASDQRLFRVNISNLALTTLTLTGGNLIHDVRYVKYSDGAEIICTSSSLGFPIFSVNPSGFTVNSTLTTAGVLWTDDMALIKNAPNTLASGCTFWLGAELGGHCTKYQSNNGVITKTNEEVFNSLPSYGLFTDGTFVYNMCRQSYIEVWPYNLAGGNPIRTGIQYLIGDQAIGGVPVWQANELWISNTGGFAFTNYAFAGAATDNGIYQFFFSPPPYATGTTDTTIYNTDGTLQGNRLVNLSAFTLSFSSATQPNTIVLSGGNVGIGTKTPVNILHVFQNTNAGSTILFENSNTGTSVYAGLQFKLGTASSYVYFTPSNYTFAQIANSVVIQNSNSGDIVLFNASETMRAKNSGNVLIGTTTDDTIAKLQVNGPIKAGTFTTGVGINAAIYTNGEVRAASGFNLRSPINNDNIFTGMVAGGLGIGFTVGNSTGAFSIGQLAGGATTGIGTQSTGSFTNPASATTGEVVVANNVLSIVHATPNIVNYSALAISPSINQAGLGSGVTRGLYMNPALPNAVDFRAIEIVVGGKIALGTTTGTSVGIGVSAQNITNIFHVSGSSNPVRIQGLTAATDPSLVTIDATGVLHTYALSNISGGTSTTLYTGDGTLQGNRVVNLSSFTLNFSSTTSPNALLLSGGSTIISGVTQVTTSASDGVQSIGTGLGRSGFYAHNTNSGGQATIYMDNDRGGFNSYGGFFMGGSAIAGSFFGVSRADKLFMFSDGANSTGMAVGTMNATTLTLGTSNAERMRINSAGVVTIGAGPDPISGVLLNINASGPVNVAFQVTNVNSAGQAAFFLANDRAALGSYGGVFAGGSTTALSNLFGLSRQDRVFMLSDGANNLGLAVGTLTAQPLYFGTNNTERMRIDGTGKIGFNIAPTYQYHFSTNSGAQNGLGIDLLANDTGTPSNSYHTVDFKIPTTGLVGQILTTASNYVGSPVNAFGAGSFSFMGNTQAILGTFGSNGFVSFVTGGVGTGNERGRITSGGTFLMGTLTDDGINKVQISAATNPLRLIGLSANTVDTSFLSVDASGAVHKYAVSAITAGISGGTQSWDSTLAISAATSRTWEYKLTDPSHAQTFEYITPDDYNPATGQSRYSRWIDSSFVNPTTFRRDVVGSWWSYNMGPAESVITPNEAAFGFISESYYQQDGTTLSEFHLPIFVDNEGGYHRLWSIYTHRPTGFSYLQSQIGSFSFRHHWDNSGSSDWFSITSGDAEIAGTGTTGTTGAAQMNLSSVGAGTGQFARFRMFDGDGGAATFLQQSLNLNIQTNTDMYLQPGRFLNMPMNVNFGQSDYFSNAYTQFTSNDNIVNHGYHFASLDATDLLWVSKGQNISWQPFNFASTALHSGRITFNTGAYASSGAFAQWGIASTTVAQINLNPTGATPTAMTNGDIAAITGHLYYRDSSITYDLINPVASIRTVTTGYTMSLNDDIILVSASTGPIAITLPAASGNTSGTTFIYTIKKIDNTGNAVTITPPSGQIEFGSNAVLSVRGASIDTFTDGTNYYIK